MIYKFYHKARGSHAPTTYECELDSLAIAFAKLIGNVVVVNEKGIVIHRGYPTKVKINFFKKTGKGYGSCKIDPPCLEYLDGNELYEWVKKNQTDVEDPDNFITVVEHDGIPFMWKAFPAKTNE